MDEKGTRLTLEEARKIINRQDRIILEAFEKRMAAAREIARSKTELGQPVYVPQREEEILEWVMDEAEEGLEGYAAEVFRKLMEVSREYQNSLRRFGLLGRKLPYSFSPEIHRRLGEFSEPYRYELFEVEPEKLEEFLLQGDWAGLNVTIPYKQDVMKYCNEIAPEAARIGAVNTLVRRNGKILGLNTDYTGFRRTVEKSGAAVSGAKCVILGSGGAAKAVAAVLSDMGAGEVITVSRTGESGCDYQMMKEKHLDAEILVNATPVGTSPNTGVSPAYPGTFYRLEWAFDLVYNPLRTNFLCQAKKSGIEGANGLCMLVSQAKASAEYFLGREIPDRACDAIVRQLTAEKENLILIGMPGCGKSTVGRILAEKTGRKFTDMDQLIVERECRSIPKIFEEGGEALFRSIEMDAAETLRHETGTVIACGGGIITREENYYALAENGRFIFLNRDISALPVDGRPISQSTPLMQLYHQRLPLYRSWCDMEVDSNGKTAEETAEEILLLLAGGGEN